MRNLPFRKIAQIEQICSTLPTEGLVLILTGKEGQGGVLVYLDRIPQFSLPNEWHFKELGELQEDDFLTWDGLAVGYDALNLQYPLLLTSGPSFYPIRYLFVATNRLDIYQDNARKLASWLYQKKLEADLSDRVITKFIELIAPAWLETNRSDGGIGLALYSPDLLSVLSGEIQPKWVTLADLENHLPSATFLLTFEKVKQIFPDLKNCPHFIEWRPILWKNDRQDVLIDALDEMAKICWMQAEKQNQFDLQCQAFTFALEKWLAQMDTEHLIAVFPNSDFNNFLRTGSAIFVKHMPKIYVGAERQQEFFTLIDLVNKDQMLQDSIRETYGGIPFCIGPILQSLQALTSSTPCPLENILYAVGKAPSLSATFLSLINDFIRYDDIKHTQFSTEQIRNMALKGTYLLALGDPWNKAWRGRFNLLLDHAYSILDDALLYDEKARQGQESGLLRAWYSLYLEKDLSRRWEELRQQEQRFAEKISAQDSYIFDVLLEKKLPAMNGKQIRDLQYAPISWEETTPTLTRDFMAFYDEWYQAHQKSTAIEQSLVHTPPSSEQIEHILGVYRNLQRRLYALPHEVIFLQYLCSNDIDTLKRLQTALQKDIALQVQPLTGKIFVGEDSRLMCEVQNIGNQDAQNINLYIEDSEYYEILARKEVPITNLSAHGGTHRFELHVRAKEEGSLSIRLAAEANGNKLETLFLSLGVIQKSKKLKAPRPGQPFQAGVAVDGDKFFGRHRELKAIFDFLLFKISQPVILRGPRRIGKTSILKQIEYLLGQPGELQRQLGYDREEEITIRLYRPVFVTLQMVKNEKDLPGWYYDLFKKILEKAKTIPDISLNRSMFDQDPHFAFERTIKEFLDNHTQMRFVILLDEWDEQLHLTELGGKLRALIQNEKRLNWVITSTWMLSAEHGRFSSPLYGQSRIFELREMLWEEARNMVEDLSEKVGVIWEPDALIRLLEQTALRPYLIQGIGQRVIEYLKSSKPPYSVVDNKAIQTVVSNFVHPLYTQDSHFNYLWNDEDSKSDTDVSAARLSWLGRLILLTLGQASPNTMRLIEIRNYLRTRFQQYDLSLDILENNLEQNINELDFIFDVIMKKGDHYLVSIPLIQAWFQNTIRQLDDPWQFAFERLKREYKQSLHINKEQR